MASQVSVLGFLHVNVEVTDLERALAFYKLFNLRWLDRQGSPGRVGAWLGLPDGRELHISQGSAKPHSRAHFAIRVADLAAARRAVEAAGAPIETEREIDGLIRFFTRDPDGNRIEVVQLI
ncbi:MAG TPA: VOC family protein [Candidatus Acidoferrales bacterium]|nr:VOC family protein [Candidatus Acidoferrales bacterium]